jgi:PAS domain S-box-containing protein
MSLPDAASIAARSASLKPDVGVRRSIRVLHLEDDLRDAGQVNDKLDVGGLACDITVAQSRGSFEAALARATFDLIISDYNVPGYDGATALKWVKEHHPDTPVIIISGALDEEEAVRCLKIGATDYLLKARLDRLVPAVQRALGEAEARRTREHTEQALLQHESALRENENRTAFALAAAGVGVWEIEFATNRMIWSDTMAAVFGLTPDQAPATAWQFFQLIHPDDRHDVEASVNRAITGEHDFLLEFRTVWPDGSTHWAYGRAQASGEAGRTPRRLLGIGIDITERKVLAARELIERKRYQDILVRKNVALEQASLMKSEFLSNMSHELRTPLNAIIGFAAVLKDGLTGEMTDQQCAFVDDIHSSGTHLLSLINEILDLSKIEAGSMTLDLEPVDVSSMLVHSCSVIREKAGSHNIRLHIDSSDVGVIQADVRRVKQILYNLLFNAVKFTGDGGQVIIRASRVLRSDVGQLSSAWTGRSLPLADNEFAEFVRISITDGGIGISHDGLERLFQPFSQVDGSLARRFEGAGLGLSVVKRLVELHGGTVAVESAVGEGSCFTVWLPFRSQFA